MTESNVQHSADAPRKKKGGFPRPSFRGRTTYFWNTSSGHIVDTA